MSEGQRHQDGAGRALGIAGDLGGQRHGDDQGRDVVHEGGEERARRQQHGHAGGEAGARRHDPRGQRPGDAAQFHGPADDQHGSHGNHRRIAKAVERLLRRHQPQQQAGAQGNHGNKIVPHPFRDEKQQGHQQDKAAEEGRIGNHRHAIIRILRQAEGEWRNPPLFQPVASISSGMPV